MVLMYTCDLELLHAITNDNKRTRKNIEKENIFKTIVNIDTYDIENNCYESSMKLDLLGDYLHIDDVINALT